MQKKIQRFKDQSCTSQSRATHFSDLSKALHNPLLSFAQFIPYSSRPQPTSVPRLSQLSPRLGVSPQQTVLQRGPLGVFTDVLTGQGEGGAQNLLQPVCRLRRALQQLRHDRRQRHTRRHAHRRRVRGEADSLGVTGHFRQVVEPRDAWGRHKMWSVRDRDYGTRPLVTGDDSQVITHFGRYSI